MKRKLLGRVGTLLLFASSMAYPAQAAELLDVKPVVSDSSVAIEVTADIPMTYTFYKVPGQARAVVDIADVDPEKIEPLIVVNKGALSSISVDKAMIAEMTVSRLVFNLMSESPIAVKQDADRKKLTVSFGGGKPVAVVEPPPVVPAVPAAALAAVVTAEPSKPVAAAAVTPPAKEDEDPLGLDEPKLLTIAPTPVTAGPAPVQLEPVVPDTIVVTPSKVVVKGIVIGSSFIEIQTNVNVEKLKHMTLLQPDRLAIDIPGSSTISVKSIAVNKFGIGKIRVGSTPGSIRIVLDAVRSPFPGYSVATTEKGVRINFK
jgi:type IV pilus assembly protein PilQ